MAGLWGVQPDHPHFPAILVPVSRKGKTFGHQTQFAVQENKESQFGVGFLPFVTYQDAAEEGILINWEEVLKEANTLLLSVRVASQMSVLEFAAISTAASSSMPEITFTGPNLIWPQLKQITASSQAGSGKDLCLLCILIKWLGLFITPVPSDVPKYSAEGAFDPRVIAASYNLGQQDAETIASFCNASLAKNTWRGYRMSMRIYLRFCRLTLCPPVFPPPHSVVLSFISYLLRKGLKATTIRVYLSGLSKMSFTMTGKKEDLLCELSRAALTGKLKLDPKVGSKVPVTTRILKIIHNKLMVRDNKQKLTKLLMWSVSLLLFWSSARTGEILSQNEMTFDEKTTLLNRNLSFVTVKHPDDASKELEILQVLLESPKESRHNESVTLEVFPVANSIFCPVRAIKRYRKRLGKKFALSPDLPVFRLSSGAALSHDRFNRFLRDNLVREVDYTGGQLSAHSFRAGRAQAMAEAGFDADAIKSLGRWKSEAWRHYVRHRRLNLRRNYKLHDHMITSLST